MAELAANTGVTEFSVNNDTVAVSRGTRVTLASTGLVAASAIGVRGDYVATVDAAASATFSAVSMQQGAIVSALASEAIVVGDPVYSAASGLFSKTSTSAVLVGKANTAASGSGILFEVILANPA